MTYAMKFYNDDEHGGELPPLPPNAIEQVSRIFSKYRHLHPLYNRNYLKVAYPIFNHPVDLTRWWISQYFGANPASYSPLKGHDGLDYACNVGTAVMCPVDRMTIIDLVLQKNSYGRHVWGQDDYGHKYIFGHLHEWLVSKGDVVTRGQIFATSGGNLDDPYHGYSTGPHLHWEWRPVWASIANGYAGAENQLPYVTYGTVVPVVIPEPEPLFYLVVNEKGNMLQERTSPMKPALNNNRTGKKVPAGTKIPVYATALEGRLWVQTTSKGGHFLCWKEGTLEYADEV